MEYTLLILLLPLLSFLLIGVVDLDIPKNGRVWSPKVAGIIGTASLAAVTVLSYVAAFQYFTGERLANGTSPRLSPTISRGCRSVRSISTSVCSSIPSR